MYSLIQIPTDALPNFLLGLFIKYLPVIFVAIIIVSIVAIVYNSREIPSEKEEKIRNIQRSKYPDFEMYLNRDMPIKKLDEES